LGWPGVHLRVEIALAHTAQELVKGRRGRAGRLQDQLALGESKIDRGIVVKADFFGEALGYPNGKAIPPSLDACLHNPSPDLVSTMIIPRSEGEATSQHQLGRTDAWGRLTASS
jgi:hypothetical protein